MRARLWLVVGVVLGLAPGRVLADPGGPETCPAASGEPAPVGGLFEPEVCFGTIPEWGGLGSIDHDGDGFGDVLVGEMSEYPGIAGGLMEGPFVWFGGPDWTDAFKTSSLVGSVSGTHIVIRNLGDVNGDGAEEFMHGWAYFGSNYCSPGSSTLRHHVSGDISTWESGGVWGGLPEYQPAGDVNGDGFDDVTLGTEVRLGRAYPPWTFNDAATMATPDTGFSVPIGDVNGDGLADLGRGGQAGNAVRWLSGGAAVLSEGPPLGVSGAVAAAGDVDGDGYDDSLVIAPLGDGSASLSLHYGSPSGPDPLGEPVVIPHAPASSYGSAVSVEPADVNGDGYGDLLVSREPQGTQSRYILLLGSPSGLAAVPSAAFPYLPIHALIQDLDGDGRDELVFKGPPGNTLAWNSLWVIDGADCPDDADCDGVADADDCAPYAGLAHDTHPEVCDGWDNDCDGEIDEGWDSDGDGWTPCAGDCDDEDAARAPGVDELCNGIDDNCNDRVDEGNTTFWFDFDGDGSQIECDCDDEDPAVSHLFEEVCFSGIDEDCDGEVDESPCLREASSWAFSVAQSVEIEDGVARGLPWADPRSSGCSVGGGTKAGAAWLLLACLVLIRRRRPERGFRPGTVAALALSLALAGLIPRFAGAEAYGPSSCPTAPELAPPAGGLFGEPVCFGTTDDAGYLTSLDHDGDGYEDLLIGSEPVPSWTWSQLAEGARVWFGGPDWIEAFRTSLQTGPELADSVGAWPVGDLDGDGADEFLVGAADYQSNYCGVGSVSLVEDRGVVSTWAAGGITGGVPGYRGVGDVNGDGMEDVVLGTQIILGRASPPWRFEDAEFLSTSDPDFTTRLGDVNGDGYADLGRFAYTGTPCAGSQAVPTGSSRARG